MVSVYLEEKFERPVFNVKDDLGIDMLCLLDTGATMSVWCQRKYLFLQHFPNAVKTNYVTTVTGFGGRSFKKREIWKIPSLAIEDIDGKERYEIKNLLVALVDAGMRQFSLILCSPLLHNTLYKVFDFDDDKHMEIYPKENRPVYCTPKGVIDSETLGELLPKEFEIGSDEIFIKGVTVFSEDVNT